MRRKRLVIISISLIFIVIIGIGIILFVKNSSHKNTVVQIQTININSKSKEISSYDVLSNGKIQKSHMPHNIGTVEKIKIDRNIFGTYTRENQTHLRLLKKIPLYDQKKHKVDDANYWKMINSIIKNVHFDIYKLTLFRVGKHYYAYVQINQWILDAGTLYEFNPKSNNLKKLCDLDGKEIVNISR